MKRFSNLLATVAIAIAPANAANGESLVIAHSPSEQIQPRDASQLHASTAVSATINVPHGSAPTNPNNGDCWTTEEGFYCRITGETVGPVLGLANSNIMTGSLQLGLYNERLIAGPSKPANPNQAIDWIFASDADQANLISIGGMWPGSTYSTFGFAKSYNAKYNGTNNNTLFIYSEAVGTSAAVVPMLSVSRARSNGSVVFGGNPICSVDSGITAKCVGFEIDQEFSLGAQAGAGSGGLFLNTFNVNGSGPAIQLGAINGAWTNGIGISGINSAGAGLFVVGGSGAMASLVNSSSGRFGTAAFVHGTGIAQGDAYGTRGGGTSPYIYGDDSNNLIAQLGSSGSLIVHKSDGKTVMAALGKPSSVSALPPCDTPHKGALFVVSDAKDPIWNRRLSGGGSETMLALCNGADWTAH